MAEPKVFDARRGISREALQELRRADRVTFALRDDATVVLGYWTQDAPSLEGAPLGVVVLRREHLRLRPGERAPGLVPFFRLLADIPHAQKDKRWKRTLSMLRVGDVVTVGYIHWAGTEARRRETKGEAFTLHRFEIGTEGELHLSIVLSSPRAQRIEIEQGGERPTG